ncbi:MAG: alpha/beta hydrolase [Thermoleophilaceae bacterium]|nr:alpha/beta hydrolase [Thermoleophilaceae bacterium]
MASSNSLPPSVASWQRAGSYVDFRGRQIYIQRHVTDGPPTVFLHGFPSSSYDWRALLDELPDCNALLFDFLGFGLSDKPRDHKYTLAWQADLVEELVLREFGDQPVFLIAHDMGTSVTTELMARELAGTQRINTAGVLLFNGSILLNLATPVLGQRLLRSRLGGFFARLTSQPVFRAQFGSVFSEEHPLTPSEASDHWALATFNGGHRLGHKLIHYMDERDRFTERWHGAVRDWVGDLHFAWGMLDPVANTDVLAGLRALRPSAPVTELARLGHYPQIEDPAVMARIVAGASAAGK